MIGFKINEKERAVLIELTGNQEDFCSNFAHLMQGTGLDRPTVRRACRSLARKGLAQYQRGLWTEDGEMAGAGYGLTRAGAEYIGEDAKP